LAVQTDRRKENAQKTPSFIEAMKALPVERLPESDCLYEIKRDGYRALAFKDGKEVRLSRAIKRRSIIRHWLTL
jgi:ATP-dependent DNA ligase